MVDTQGTPVFWREGSGEERKLMGFADVLDVGDEGGRIKDVVWLFGLAHWSLTLEPGTIYPRTGSWERDGFVDDSHAVGFKLL